MDLLFMNYQFIKNIILPKWINWEIKNFENFKFISWIENLNIMCKSNSQQEFKF